MPKHANATCERADAPPHIPVPQWPKYFAWPTIGGLRYWIFNADNNGFNRVIRRVGRRILIDVAAFHEWIDSQGGRK